MKVPLIRNHIQIFKKYLQSPLSESEIYKWECLQNFQDTWDLSELDLYSMYKKSFSSTISNRLWVGNQYDPKKIMLEFIKLDKEFVRSMFRDLFNESKDLMMRISRFLFHCDSLMEELNRRDKKYNAHYHDSYKMISIYLAFKYPRKYTIYEYHPFISFMKKVGALKEPLENEIEKFFTVMKSLYVNFLSKDEELLKLHENRFYGDKFSRNENMLLTLDFYSCQNNGYF